MTNYAQGMILSFEENPILPENTTVRVLVSPPYVDGDILTLYFYNADGDKLSVEAKELTVTGGKVEFSLTHTSTYFLSQTVLKSPGMIDYVFVLVSIVEAFIIVLLLLRSRRPRKVKRDL